MSDTPSEDCKRIRELMSAQISIINRHIDDHKWFTHIENANEGMMDFIERYGWLMREMYCGYACPDRIDCVHGREARKRKNGNGEEDSSMFLG
jgi:hypothetical protein